MKKRESDEHDGQRSEGDEERRQPELSKTLHPVNGTRMWLMEDGLASTCPRCSQSLGDAEYYGVCSMCAEQLRSTYDGTARADVEAADYEPKMNVTPNAVALKE